jgi:uncharacterized lipoprotein YddW (UPF0748 family)
MWCSRFDWTDYPNTTQAGCKAVIDTLMQKLKDNNFNAVFFQVRGQCDTLYPSPYETWSPLVNETDPGWDPLAYAIDKAHANGVEFYAYINTHTCWQPPGTTSSHTLPADPNHTFYAHCNAADPAHHDWLICNSSGTPVQWSENDYVWIAPGIPEFQAYWRRQVLYVIQNYNVDGVQFDRIRTPNSSYSYDPISQARRLNAQSNPAGLDFHHWTADQTTRMLCDLYAQVMAVKPQVKMTASPFPNPLTSPTNQHQDSLAWLAAGAMDMVIPMMYSSGAAGTAWDTQLQTWLNNSAGRQIVAGQITSESGAPTMLTDQIALTRIRGGAGNNVFSSGSFGSSYWSTYKANVYQDPTSTPTMSWKTNPTSGIIYGYVTASDTGGPVVDAQVVRAGSSYTALSSGDGIYSFLLVPPGTYSVTASHPARGTATVSGIPVTAGAVIRRDITFGPVLPPIIDPVTPNPDSASVGGPYTRQLTLAQGTAETWTLLEGPSGAAVDAYGFIHGWTPAPADAGQPFTFTVRASNAGGSDDESWTVLVPVPPPCATFKLTDFDAYDNGARVLFNLPRYSGSTSTNLATSPNVAQITEAVTAFSGSKCLMVQWKFVDATTQRWMRLTASNGPVIPNPTMELDRPVRVRIRLDSGRLRLCMGVRETGTTADIGADGGTSGAIEFVGASGEIGSAPQGVLVDPMPGVWQTFIFDPRNDPVVTLNGDGVLYTSSNKGVFEQLAFSAVDSAGPFTVYIDDIDFLCDSPGDYDYDSDVDLTDFGHFQACFNGPNRPPALSDGCRSADLDRDSDVDLADFATFQACFNGPNRPAACP